MASTLSSLHVPVGIKDRIRGGAVIYELEFQFLCFTLEYSVTMIYKHTQLGGQGRNEMLGVNRGDGAGNGWW